MFEASNSMSIVIIKISEVCVSDIRISEVCISDWNSEISKC